MAKDGIQAEIDRLRKPLTEKLGLNAEFLLSTWLRALEKSMADIPVLDKKGEPTGEYRFDSAGVNKALENLAKYVDMPKQQSGESGESNPLLVFAMKAFQLPPGSSGETVDRLLQEYMQAARAITARK